MQHTRERISLHIFYTDTITLVFSYTRRYEYLIRRITGSQTFLTRKMGKLKYKGQSRLQRPVLFAKRFRLLLHQVL